MSQRSLKPKKILFFVQAYNVLAAQIEQTKQLGQKLEAKILDVRDVDVSGEVCVNFVTLVTFLVVNVCGWEIDEDEYFTKKQSPDNRNSTLHS